MQLVPYAQYPCLSFKFCPVKKTSVETFACVRVVFTFVNPPNRVLYLLTFSETSVFMESGFLILLLPIVFLECKSKFVFIYSLSIIFFF